MNQSDLDKVIDHFTHELTKVKTGRANPELIENVPVDAYGSKMPLKELATISIPEARQFLIVPYDKNNMKAIESALSQTDLGTSPQAEDDKIRLILPALTEETRQKEAADIHKKAEEAKVSIRDLRHKAQHHLKDDKSLSEEESEHKKKEIDETVHEYNDKIDEMAKKKEEEVMKM